VAGRASQGAATTGRSRLGRTTVTPSTTGIVRLPTTRGPALTPRDTEILTWVGRYGVVTADQIARRFFSRDDGAVGQAAAYRRLRKLRELDLLRMDRTFYMEPSVIRLTTRGARQADCGVGPAKLVLAEVRHALAVVDVVEDLLARNRGADLTTERELRIGYRQELADGARPGRNRLPDAVLVIKGKTIAVEVDLTSKRSNDYERILGAYVRQEYDAVWWYVRPRVVARLQEIVKRGRATDFVSVRPLPEDR